MKLKSDLGVFTTHYLGIGIWIIGGCWGLGMALFVEGLRVFGLVICAASFFIGKYFVFKSKRRKGHIHYYGGEI